jgi:hypothetical protein
MVDEDGDYTCCKVGRMMATYGITEFDEELQHEWLADDGASLRTLETRFNQRLLESAMEREGTAPLEGEVENLYRLLTDDDVSAGKYTQAKNRLEKVGVDVAELQSDFVSYQSINRHLQKCRELKSNSQDQSPSPRKLRSRIYALESRTASVTESTLEQLKRMGELHVTNPSVFVDLNVVCETCGKIISVDDALSGTPCDCDDDV